MDRADPVKRKSSIGHRPGKSWEFDEAVVEVFDDMLERSIPSYWEMRGLVGGIAARFIERGGVLLDLGASLGGVYESVAQACGQWPSGAKYIGLESSAAMVKEAEGRIRVKDGYIQEWDLALDGLPDDVRANVVTCVLTLQFIAMEHRVGLLKSMNDALAIGGALLLVEKIVPMSSSVGEMMDEEYIAYKHANGYSLEEIEAKRIALQGVLVPATAIWNEEQLTAAGFRGIECFWRWHNFAGWIALKG